MPTRVFSKNDCSLQQYSNAHCRISYVPIFSSIGYITFSLQELRSTAELRSDLWHEVINFTKIIRINMRYLAYLKMKGDNWLPYEGDFLKILFVGLLIKFVHTWQLGLKFDKKKQKLCTVTYLYLWSLTVTGPRNKTQNMFSLRYELRPKKQLFTTWDIPFPLKCKHRVWPNLKVECRQLRFVSCASVRLRYLDDD